jgi:hypothetical protein
MDADYVDQLVKRGVISDDVAAQLTGSQPQRQSRFDILRQGLDAAKDYLTPGYFRDTPSSPQADRALADPNARPGKIGPPSGPPTGMKIAGGLAGDIGLNALPFGKLAPELAAIPFWIKSPTKAARADELIAKGFGRQAIADDIEVGKAAVGRYLDLTGKRTAAAENFKPGVLGDPGNDEVIKAGLAQGDSYATIAKRIGTSAGNVHGRVNRGPNSLRAAGELSGIELRPSDQSKSLLADPVKRADLIRLAKEGTSQGDIASYFFGGPGGNHPRRGYISTLLKTLREQGEPELQDYVPQGGAGITAAGRTPTVVQTKTQQREALPLNQDYVKALRALGLAL